MKPSEKAPTALLSQINEVRGQITQTQRIWMMNIAVCLVTAVVGVVAIQMPWQEHRQQLAAQYADEKERAELLQAIVGQRTQLQTLEKKFLLEGGATALTGQISRLATEASLQIESVAPQPELALEPYMKYQIEIFASSSLMNVLHFLRSVETHEPLFWVDQLEIGELPGETLSFSGMAFDQQTSTQKQPADLHRIKLIIGALARQKVS